MAPYQETFWTLPLVRWTLLAIHAKIADRNARSSNDSEICRWNLLVRDDLHEAQRQSQHIQDRIKTVLLYYGYSIYTHEMNVYLHLEHLLYEMGVFTVI